MGGERERSVVRVRIEGRVQGVGYRYWVIDQAAALGLDGWVRNRADGSVEAVFAGPGPLVADMVERCRKGPSLAYVTRVETLSAPAPDRPGFHVLPTV
jgi:acylphosphatase